MTEYLCVLTLVALTIQPLASGQGNSSKVSLFSKFFDENGSYKPSYKQLTPLSSDGKRPVWLGVEVKKIIELSDKHGQLTLSVHYTVMWYDHRLRWNPDQYSHTKMLHVPATTIWIPTIFLLNNARANGGRLGMDEDLSQQLVAVHSNGKCVWETDTFSVTACDFDVRKFPFDRQTCELQFQTRRTFVHLMNYDEAVNKTAKIDDGEWILCDTLYLVSNHGIDRNNYSDLVVTLHLQRQSFYYIVNFIVPCFAFSFINLLTFMVKPGSGERVGVSISVLLGIIIYQMIVNDKLPETSEAIPVMSVYIQLIMVTAVISTAKFMFITYLHGKEPHSPLVRRFLCVHLVQMMCIKRKSNDNIFIDSKASVNGVIDASLVSVENDKFRCKNTSQHLDDDAIVSDSTTRLSSCKSTSGSGDELLRDILLVLQRIEANTKNQQVVTIPRQAEEDHISQEWMLAVSAIDRLCFLICLVLSIGNNIYILWYWLGSFFE